MLTNTTVPRITALELASMSSRSTRNTSKFTCARMQHARTTTTVLHPAAMQASVAVALARIRATPGSNTTTRRRTFATEVAARLTRIASATTYVRVDCAMTASRTHLTQTILLATTGLTVCSGSGSYWAFSEWAPSSGRSMR